MTLDSTDYNFYKNMQNPIIYSNPFRQKCHISNRKLCLALLKVKEITKGYINPLSLELYPSWSKCKCSSKI